MMMDHRNHNGLDNRKKNLRITDNRQNQANQRIREGFSSKYKGVRRRKTGKYEAAIETGRKGQKIFLGSYDCEEEAAFAYNKKALELNGNCAQLNDLPPKSEWIYPAFKSKNIFKHNADGTTHIFVKSKNKQIAGEYVIVIDTEDWESVKYHKLWLHSRGLPLIGKDAQLLSHFVAGDPPRKGMIIAYNKSNRCDNRRENIFFVSRSEWAGKLPGHGIKKTSQYRGVYWNKKDKRWYAQVSHEGRRVYVGCFTCEHQAALAWNKKALELWGENALLNEVEQSGYKVVGSG